MNRPSATPRPSGAAIARLPILVAAVAAVCALSWVVMVYRMLADPEYGGLAVDIDFSVFWAAAQLALDGRWLAPFDPDVLNAARALPPGRDTHEMLWFYPPGYHVLIRPFGHLPFFWAWLAFVGLSAGALALALRRAARGVPGGYVFVLCAPVTLLVLALGQNSLFMVALLLTALEALRRGQPLLAGLALAAMTLKPQLGVAIPVALVAAGYWRAIGWGALFTAALTAATLVFPDPGYWPAFFRGLAEGSARLREGGLEPWMISGYGTAVVAGLSDGWALAAQGALSLSAAAALAWLWRGPAGFDLKAAGLCFATLLITPYAIHYELVFAVAGALYLIRDGLAVTAPGRLAVTLVWFAPAIGILGLPAPGFAVAAPLVAAALGLTLVRAGRARRTRPA